MEDVMNWVLLLVLLGWAAIPSFLLMADRILDVDSAKVIRLAGGPFIVGSIALLAVTGLWDSEYLELVGWGALAGLLGTITLDIVRIIGVKASLFPLDMPIMFGFMAFGQAPKLQASVMGQVLNNAVREGTVKEFVEARISRIPKLPERQQINAAAAMMAGIGTLDEAARQEIGEAQFAALSQLPDVDRRTVMGAMDGASAATESPSTTSGVRPPPALSVSTPSIRR